MDIPDTNINYSPRFSGKRGQIRRDTILVRTKPGDTRPTPKPIPETDRTWRPKEWKF